MFFSVGRLWKQNPDTRRRGTPARVKEIPARERNAGTWEGIPAREEYRHETNTGAREAQWSRNTTYQARLPTTNPTHLNHHLLLSQWERKTTYQAKFPTIDPTRLNHHLPPSQWARNTTYQAILPIPDPTHLNHHLLPHTRRNVSIYYRTFYSP